MLTALRIDAVALGVIGGDGEGSILRDTLVRGGVDVSGLVTDPDRPTTVKRNLIGLAQHRHPQKMFRMDVESRAPLSDKVRRELLDRAESLLDDADILILEDYDKGVLTPASCESLIALARAKDVPVYVDPAPITDYQKYSRATVITPNRTEAAKALGEAFDDTRSMSAVEAMAQEMRNALALEAVVLTLDKQGVLLLQETSAEHVPTRAREVYDVTGAGDVLVATLAAARCNGATWRQAVELANAAAGLEVERSGVVPIPFDDLLLSVLNEAHDELGKLRTLDRLLPEIAAHRAAGKRIAFTNGCFDILHAGHVQFLRRARKEGDLLVVALNTDDSIRRLKGDTRPVNALDDRVTVMSELESVDYIVPFAEDEPKGLLEALKPDALVKGGDYTREQVVGHEIVERYGGRVVVADLVEGRSTTNLIHKIQGG